MFKPVGAKSVDEYFEMLAPERRESIEKLDELIQKTVPHQKRHFAYNMIGYGSFPYVNYKKQQIEWPLIALASQKNYMSLYICALNHGEYLAELHKDKLGKVSVGKSCIRFKRLEDLHLDAVKGLLKEAEKSPRMVGVSEHKS